MPGSPIRGHGRRIAGGLVIAGVVGAIVVLALRPAEPLPVVGMVRSTETKIAPEVSGRIIEIAVRAGDRVAAGAVLAQLGNPELAAAVEEARATVGAATAKRAHVYAGLRQEEVDIVTREMEKAAADLTLAEQQFRRTSTVAKAGFASEQKLDEAKAKLTTAQAKLDSLQLQLAEAQHGATAEDRAIADAQVAAAEASLNVLLRKEEKLELRSPVDGVVQTIVAELGEATVPGRTVLTLAGSESPWFSFNIREDALGDIAIGTVLTLTQAGNDRPVPARVSEIRRLGDFATWRAARAVGDHDLNVFAVRADSVEDVEYLEPGMTVWIVKAPAAPQ